MPLFVWFSSFIHSVLMLRSSKRSDLIVSGYIVGLFNVFMVICIGLFQENNQYMFYIIMYLHLQMVLFQR